MPLLPRAALESPQMSSMISISVVLHDLFVRNLYVAVSRAKFAENVYFVLSSPD